MAARTRETGRRFRVETAISSTGSSIIPLILLVSAGSFYDWILSGERALVAGSTQSIEGEDIGAQPEVREHCPTGARQ